MPETGQASTRPSPPVGGAPGGAARAGAPRRRSTRGGWVRNLATPPNVYVLPAAIFLLATVGYAIGYSINLSMRGGGLAALLAGDAPFVGLENYFDLFQQRHFRNALLTSVIFSGSSLALQFMIAFGFALAFHAGFAGHTVARALLLLAWVLPPVVAGSLFRWMLDGTFGLVNYALQWLGVTDGAVYFLSSPNLALGSVIVASVWVGVPFQTVLLLAGLRALPESVYEAAHVDGAGSFQALRYITWPLVKPVSLTVLLLSAIWSFKAFDTIFIMTGGGPARATQVLPLYAYDSAFRTYDFARGASASVVLMCIPLALGLLYLRAARRQWD